MISRSRVMVGLFIFISILITPSVAVHSVEDLYQQGERTANEISEMRKSVDSMRDSFDKSISSVGVKLIVVLTLEYVSLNCIYYLMKVFYSYYNRRKLRDERDWLVDSMKEEVDLIRKKNYALQYEINLMAETHNNLLRVVKDNVKPQHPARNLLIFAAFSFLFIMSSLFMLMLNPIVLTKDPTLNQYGMYVPVMFAFAFVFFGIKFYWSDLKKFRNAKTSNDSLYVDSIRGEMVDIPDEEDLKKHVNTKKDTPVLDSMMKSLKDKIKKLKGEQVDEEIKAKPIEPIEESVKSDATGVSVSLGSPAVEQTNGGVKSKVDLPDLDEAIEDIGKDGVDKTKNEDMTSRVLEILKSNSGPMISIDVRNAMGLSGISGNMKITQLLKKLTKKGILAEDKNKEGRTTWTIAGSIQ